MAEYIPNFIFESKTLTCSANGHFAVIHVVIKFSEAQFFLLTNNFIL